MFNALRTMSSSLVVLLSAVSAIAQTAGTISAPAAGTLIAPGEAFDFSYSSHADYGISSYNYTVWLSTTPPTSMAQSDTFMTGHYFGRFSEPNYPGIVTLINACNTGTNYSSFYRKPRPQEPSASTACHAQLCCFTRWLRRRRKCDQCNGLLRGSRRVGRWHGMHCVLFHVFRRLIVCSFFGRRYLGTSSASTTMRSFMARVWNGPIYMLKSKRRGITS